MKIKIISIFKKQSAIWRYGYQLYKNLSKNNQVDFIDLWEKNNLKRAIKLIKGIKIPECDVLILVSPLLSKSLIKSNAKLKIVIAYDFYPLLHNEGTSLFVKELCKLTYNYIKFSDLVFAISKQCSNELKKLYNLDKNVYIINGGLDSELFKAIKKQKKGNLFLHVGRNDARKNFKFVLEIFKELNIHNKKLIKIGDISKEEEKIIEVNKLNVKIINSVSDKKLKEIYNKSDILLFPSKYEGLGLPPLEAMACGCPVLAANNTGLKEVCLKESLLELNKEKWIKEIYKILNNKNYKKSIIKKGFKKVKTFNWKEYSSEVEKIIKARLK